MHMTSCFRLETPWSSLFPAWHVLRDHHIGLGSKCMWRLEGVIWWMETLRSVWFFTCSVSFLDANCQKWKNKVQSLWFQQTCNDGLWWNFWQLVFLQGTLHSLFCRCMLHAPYQPAPKRFSSNWVAEPVGFERWRSANQRSRRCWMLCCWDDSREASRKDLMVAGS